VSVGGPSVIELPVRSPDVAEPPMSAFLAPESTPPPPGHVDFGPWRRHARDVATGRITLDVGAAERTRLDRDGLTFGEELSRRYEIDDGRPLSARVQCRGDHFLQRGSWRISIRVRTAMTGTAESFLITSELDAFEDGVRVFARRSDVSVPRDLV
jgi:hypothetical protein